MIYEHESSIGEIIRKQEKEYTRGNTTISEYVNFNMYETINKIEAYLNSKHTTGENDSLGRPKPFFNIVVGASNIWYRATDIDTSQIRIRPTKTQDDIVAFLATVKFQDWMRRQYFGSFLNEWGRVLARYGSAVTKFVPKQSGLKPIVVPWNRLIVDSIDFENNIKIEVLELNEAQLRKNKLYDKKMVDGLCDALVSRETLDKKRKDNKSDYIKLYEVHGEFPLSLYKQIKGKKVKESDKEEYVQMMCVVSFVGSSKKGDYDDFVLYCGLEEKDPYMISHLIKEDGRTLAIGAVEHLFDAQWMQNYTAKSIKDQLDLGSKLLFQTSDGNFVGQNALSSIENGQILIHADNQPITQLNNKPDISAQQAFSAQWKQLGNEINGISDAMMGEVKAGSAWKQTEAILTESHSLFDLMQENKGNSLIEMIRLHILPSFKKTLSNSDEVSATLKSYDLNKIDTKYIRNQSIRLANKHIKDTLLSGGVVSNEEQAILTQQLQSGIKQGLDEQGTIRYFSPDDLTDKHWKELFKDIEWEFEIDVTGESKDIKENLTTINTALQIVMNPAYQQNKQAQFLVGKVLEMTGTVSPMELASIPSMASGPTAGSAEAINLESNNTK
jgi:hypothetical protein